jgi:peptidyl-prolyl cis-trans isomerase B (cyclophilin B)
VAGSAKRERQLAREHYERQQARRRESADRRRKLQQGGAIALAVALVIGGVVALALALNGNEESTVATKGADSPTPTSEATSSPSPSATEGAGCTYSKTGEPAATDVGIPSYDASHPEQYERPFTATLVTNRGDVTIEMATAEAPCTTNSFRHLADEGYFDGTSCHRLTTSNIFVLQCGDPTGSGSGGPGYQFGEENLPADGENNYPAGTVAMANAGSGTNGSQFFLVYEDTTLPPDYTIFGTVTKGLDVVQAVAEAGVEGGGGDGTPAKPVTIESVRIPGKG